MMQMPSLRSDAALQPEAAKVAEIVSVGVPLGLAGAALRLWTDPVPLRERTASDVSRVIVGNILLSVVLVGAARAFGLTSRRPARAVDIVAASN